MIITPRHPQGSSNEELSRSLGEVCKYLELISAKGLAHPGVSAEQMNSMTLPTDAGKTVLNETEGKLFKSSIDMTKKIVTWTEVG